MVALIQGSRISAILTTSGMSAGLCSWTLVAVGHLHLVDHRGRGGDEIEIEFAAQPLLDDLEVQKAEKTAAEAEAERGGGLHFIGEAGVVQTQLAHGRAQILEIIGIDRERARRRPPAGRGGSRAAPLPWASCRR